MKKLQGIAVSAGVAIGEAMVMDTEGFRIPRQDFLPGLGHMPDNPFPNTDSHRGGIALRPAVEMRRTGAGAEMQQLLVRFEGQQRHIIEVKRFLDQAGDAAGGAAGVPERGPLLRGHGVSA